jgi:hypothetical protein
MKWLADQIHSMGLKFGMYGALGYHQCCSGSADNTADDGSGAGCSRAKPSVCRNETFFERDANLWASWGIDLLKVRIGMLTSPPTGYRNGGGGLASRRI